MKTIKRKLGDLGEDIAERYLKRSNYKIIKRNYQRNWGEIDIIAKKKKTIFFIEVKTITKNSEFGSPFDKIDDYKIKKLLQCAELFLIENKYPEEQDWQIDVIGVIIDNQKNNVKLKRLKDVV